MEKPLLIKVDEDLKDLIPDYQENTKKQIAEIKQCLEKRDFVRIKLTAHSLKGTGNSFGFAFISDCGKAIEEAAAVEDCDAIRDQIDQFYEKMDRLSIRFVPEDQLSRLS